MLETGRRGLKTFCFGSLNAGRIEDGDAVAGKYQWVRCCAVCVGGGGGGGVLARPRKNEIHVRDKKQKTQTWGQRVTNTKKSYRVVGRLHPTR